MKSFFFVLPFLCFHYISSSAQVLSVSPTKMNILYIGVSNPLTIALEGISDDKITVTISQGEIRKIGRGLYEATVMRPGEAVITASWENKNAVNKFRVKALSEPIPFFMNDISTCKSLSYHYKQCRPSGIMAEFKGDFNAKCEIKSYTVVYLPKNNDPQEFKVIGQSFPQNLTDIVRKAKVGDKFSFLEIRYKGPGDYNSGFTNSLEYVVKD